MSEWIRNLVQSNRFIAVEFISYLMCVSPAQNTMILSYIIQFQLDSVGPVVADLGAFVATVLAAPVFVVDMVEGDIIIAVE